MVLKTIFYTFGIYILIKALIVLIFQKSIILWALKLAKNQRSVRKLIILEIILGLILLIIGYLVR